MCSSFPSTIDNVVSTVYPRPDDFGSDEQPWVRRVCTVHELEPGTDKLGWLHVHSTNSSLIYDQLDRGENTDEAQKVREAQRKVFLAQFAVTNSILGDQLLGYRETGYHSSNQNGSSLKIEDNRFPGNVMPCSVIVFPCLELTTIGFHENRRTSHKDLYIRPRTPETGREIPFPLKAEAARHMHLERTLDEAYFPGLDPVELAERNSDQIVSRGYKDIDDWPKEDVPIVVVPQLWLWKFGNFVISARSDTRWSKMLEADGDLDNNPSTPELIQSHADVQLGLIMGRCIKAFGREHLLENGKKIPPVLQLFEIRVVAILSDVKRYMKNPKRSAIDYDEEEEFHHVLSDCRSELAMIQYFLQQQEEILDALLKDCAEKSTASAHPNDSDWTGVKMARETLRRYCKTAAKIDGDAERIEKIVQDLLNLKRTYASVQDSHASVLLSVAAIGFAIVTIIFAPMAFLVGLFALDLQGFDSLRVKEDSVRNNTGASVTDGIVAYDSGKMAGIFVGTEVLTILVTCLLVWVSLRMFNIELSDFWTRGRSKKSNAETPAVQAPNDGANQGENVLDPEANNDANQAEAGGPQVERTSWRERLHMGTGKKGAQVKREAAQP